MRQNNSDRKIRREIMPGCWLSPILLRIYENGIIKEATDRVEE